MKIVNNLLFVLPLVFICSLVAPAMASAGCIVVKDTVEQGTVIGRVVVNNCGRTVNVLVVYADGTRAGFASYPGSPTPIQNQAYTIYACEDPNLPNGPDSNGRCTK
jgi:hypothetical protein